MGDRPVARTRRLGFLPDLAALADDDAALFVRGTDGVLGLGRSGEITIERGADGGAQQVSDALGAHDVDDEVDLPGTGPVALGALPFDPSAPGRLVVPRVVIGRRGDDAWITFVGTDAGDDAATIDQLARRTDASEAGFADDGRRTEAPGRYTIDPHMSAEQWCEAVAEVTRRLRDGEASKVVLARAIDVITDRPVRPTTVLAPLRRAFPAAHLFSIDGLLGASPELLVARDGEVVHAHPMAGTAPRSGDADTDARLAATLFEASNTLAEHRFTIDMVHDTLLPWCSYLDEEAEPSIVAMANVQHLGTRLEGRLSSPLASVLELVGALHPTPAVGGVPRTDALAMIAELERPDRGRYAGPVGWIDHRGNGTWAVGIRSAELDGTRTRVWAGVGVVADSDPATELAETRAKAQAMLSAIVRP